MKIYNVSPERSSGIIVIFGVLSSIVPLLVLIGYCLSGNEFSLISFFQWAFSAFLEFQREDAFGAWLITIILPVIFYSGLIITIINRNKAVKEFNSDLNIKYVNFLPNRIDFFFNQPNYNISCSYQDIEKLKMEIVTRIYYSKGRSYTACEQIILTFNMLNNKKFILHRATQAPTKLVLNILKYVNQIENFSYKFSGAGEIPDLKEKIENFQRTGQQQILGKVAEKQCLFASISLFLMGVTLFAIFSDIIKDSLPSNFWPVLIPGSFFIFIAFIVNIVLAVNKINNRKFEVFGQITNSYSYKDKLVKNSIWYVIGIETLITFAIMYNFYAPFFAAKNDTRIQEINPRQSFQDFQNLEINEPSEYNYMSKNQIYRIRKDYVKRSLFASAGYEPSEQVFGQIVDNKPWWGLIKCGKLNYTGDYHENIEGDSKVSIQMNNPNALVGLSMPYQPWDVEDYGDFCSSEYGNFKPISLKYNEKENYIISKYALSRDFVNMRVNIDNQNQRPPIQLSGLNALDFGYNYVWAFNSSNIKMLYYDSNNVINNIQEFRDFVHLGGSCKYEGGCNNISPMQPELMITVTDLPAEINLKLWKKHPKNKYQQADMYYKIIFEE